jgi:hypothetical protein
MVARISIKAGNNKGKRGHSGFFCNQELQVGAKTGMSTFPSPKIAALEGCYGYFSIINSHE